MAPEVCRFSRAAEGMMPEGPGSVKRFWPCNFYQKVQILDFLPS
jgi:hypothetical protein